MINRSEDLPVTLDMPDGIAGRFPEPMRERLLRLRRDLHRHPELGFDLEWTSNRVREELEDLGISDITVVAETGLIARIPGTDPKASAIALRGDMDALPIQEETGFAWASEHPGMMHACGHDVHTSWLVGAACLLLESQPPRDVYLIFQPAEEIGLGAKAMLDSAAFPNVSAIFGGHVDRRFAVGEVVAQEGPIGASADNFTITLTGRASHGARPHQGIDPIIGASALVMAAQTIVSRKIDPGQPGVISFGTINAGSAANVIPETATLTGTIRAFDPEVRDYLNEALEKMAYDVASTHGLECCADFRRLSPPVINAPEAVAIAASAVQKVLGADAIVPMGHHNMGGEDFAYYQERIPGCFLRIGAREAGTDNIPAHSPAFYAADEAIFIGAAVLAQCAWESS